MSRYLAGDGIGPEVTEAALASLPDDLEFVPIAASAERYLDTGETITEEEIATIRSCDALLFGAIGDPRVQDGVLERGVLLRLRKELDLYVNLRPFPELDLVFVRENTEGGYAGLGIQTPEISLRDQPQHPEGGRTLLSLRRRAGGRDGTNADPRAQDERPDLRREAVA